MKSRAESIHDALRASSTPPSVPPPRQNMTPIGLAGHVVKGTIKKQYQVGGMTRMLYQLPEPDMMHVLRVANLVDDQEDRGRYGNKQSVYEHFEVEPAVGERVLAGLQTDHVANELINRRGNDSSLPLPELTRRDVIEAAFDANQD